MTKVKILENFNSEEEAKQAVFAFLNENEVELVSYEIVQTDSYELVESEEYKQKQAIYENEWKAYRDKVFSLNPFKFLNPGKCPMLPIPEWTKVGEDKFKVEIIYNRIK